MNLERDAYAIAEEEAARALCRATDSTLGKDLFIGHPDDAPICDTFQFDDVPTELGAQFATSRQLDTVAINASLRITAARRGQVAQKLTLLLSRYPYIQPGEELEALALLRIREDGFPAIARTPIYMEDGSQAYAWQADVGLVALFKVR